LEGGKMEKENDYVNFDIVREKTGMQAQYATRYAAGELGEGLRFRNLDPGNFQGKIYKEDVDEFIRRLNDRPSARFFRRQG
jgi:hypothetical protein